jgi:hypothetical protein
MTTSTKWRRKSSIVWKINSRVERRGRWYIYHPHLFVLFFFCFDDLTMVISDVTKYAKKYHVLILYDLNGLMIN